MPNSDYYWRKDSFNTLEQLNSLLANSPYAALFEHYIEYLSLRKKGLRREALAAADRFILAHHKDPFEIRQRVCWYLVEITERHWFSWPEVGSENWVLPGNVIHRLFIPTWEEWRAAEPRNVNAWLYRFGWASGLASGAETAFLLEPENLRCQYAYLLELESALDFAFHELESYGVIMMGPKPLSEIISSLSAVADAMSVNLNPDIPPYLKWLTNIASIHSAFKDVRADIRAELVRNGIPLQSDAQRLSPMHWFRKAPDFLRA
jgi:hypothetical protein